MTSDEIFNLALQHHHAGDLAGAAGLYRQALAQQPDHADALHLLGVIASQTGQHAAGAELIGRAIKLNAAVADYHANLGLALAAMGRFQDAIDAYRRALALRPAYPEALHSLGDALCRLGSWEEAVTPYQAALTYRPQFGPTHCNLARALVRAGRLDEAIAQAQIALAHEPNLAEAHVTLGNAHRLKDDLDQAIAAFENAIARQPNFAEAIADLASARKAAGDIAASLALSQRAMALVPDEPTLHSNYLYTLVFSPDHDAAAILREHQIFDQRHARGLANPAPRHPMEHGRRLKVGYVSPNFRHHSQAPFIHPLLRSHDRTAVEVFGYSDVARPDAITAKLQACCDVWRSIVGMTDAAAAEMVRNDQIDILVDLTMHMANGRPLLFARKPAAVQVAWLAYPGTTGLSAMDYRLTDAYLDPLGQGNDRYAEKSVRLPETFACFDPMALEAESAVAVLPALANGYVTFGCLNNFCKVNEGVLKLWASVLCAAPGSRLRLLAPRGEARSRVVRTLLRYGVDAARVDFVSPGPRAQYLAEFGKIDICLDTLPYNGHTTTLESIWFGVPVVSRVGGMAAGRAGLSVLTNLELGDWAAGDDDEFRRVACELAGDVPRLAERRRGLRERMRGSVLTEGRRFAGNVEAAYRAMWETYLVDAGG